MAIQAVGADLQRSGEPCGQPDPDSINQYFDRCAATGPINYFCWSLPGYLLNAPRIWL